MRAVLKEAQRLSPVLAGNARKTGRDIVLNGYQVPEGVSRENERTWSSSQKINRFRYLFFLLLLFLIHID